MPVKLINKRLARRIDVRAIWCLLLSMAVLPVAALAAAPNIPEMHRIERSDWINVKKLGAVGDGKGDDTAAIQQALDLLSHVVPDPAAGEQRMSAAYLPPGTYRITKTLVFPNSVGASLIGSGALTRIVWDGPEGKNMLETVGMALGDFNGIVWDGRGKAGSGVAHSASERFESACRHRNEAFIGVGTGIASNSHALATSEMDIINCLFERCGHGVRMDNFNYYNIQVSLSEFRDCGIGVQFSVGNGYVRLCHFERSKEADVAFGTVNRNSMRGCTSWGSKRFAIATGSSGFFAQDCAIGGWTASDGAILPRPGSEHSFAGLTFTAPPNRNPPIVFNDDMRPIVVSGIVSKETDAIASDMARIIEVPAGKLAPVTTDPHESFLRSAPIRETKVFDAVRDFGALNDKSSEPNESRDDTAAVRRCIEAAAQAGKGAIAYLPAGLYFLSESVPIRGKDFVVAGSGERTRLTWSPKHSETGTLLDIQAVRNVRVEYLDLPRHLLKPGAVAIRVGGDQPVRLKLDRLFGPDGPNSATPEEIGGLLMENLSAESIVLIDRLDMRLTLRDCSAAYILANFINSVGVRIEGNTAARTGFFAINHLNSRNLWVRDNHSLTIGDYYTEQSGDWGKMGGDTMNCITAEGREGQPAGKLMVGGARLYIVDTNNVVRLKDYAGAFVLANATISTDLPAARRHRWVQRGERPVRMLSLSNSGDQAPELDLEQFDHWYSLGETYGEFHNSAWIAEPKFLPSDLKSGADKHSSRALALDGKSHLVLERAAEPVARPCTWNFWVKPAEFDQPILLAGEYGGGLRIMAEPALRLTYTAIGPKGLAEHDTGPLTSHLKPGEWQMVSLVMDDTNVRLYLNGKEIAQVEEANAPHRSHSRTVGIGGISELPEGVNGFSGLLDDVRIYTSALGGQHLNALFSARGSADGDAEKLWSHLSFDGNSRVLEDATGNRRTGVVYDATRKTDTSEAKREAARFFDETRTLVERDRRFNLPKTARSNSRRPGATGRD